MIANGIAVALCLLTIPIVVRAQRDYFINNEYPMEPVFAFVLYMPGLAILTTVALWLGSPSWTGRWGLVAVEFLGWLLLLWPLALLNPPPDLHSEPPWLRTVVSICLPAILALALGAVLLDLGFEPAVGRVAFMLGRCAGIAAHVLEELSREKPMRITVPFTYDGP